MSFSKKGFISTILILALVTFLIGYQLPYYIYKPGAADELDSIVEVENGYESEGDMHLVTIRGGQATPLQFLWANVMPHQDIIPINQVFPEGVTQDEYFHAQLEMMENSQEASMVVAYQAADAEIEISYEGVYVVSVLSGMPAEDSLQAGDKIVAVDGQQIQTSQEIIDYVSTKEDGDTVELEIEREQEGSVEQLTEQIELAPFPNDSDRVGVGIQLVTNRDVEVDPPVEFASGNIGGPSAGLMFSLEIYDQLVEEDITKGYEIAGTGEINYEGIVGRIGGVDKKVITADEEGNDIFFAHNEEGAENSNYKVALETAQEIDTDMKIVPVDTFEEALTYLEELEPKEN